jgi:hypothetical protein
VAPTDNDQGWSEAHGSAVREAAPEVPAFTASERSALWHRIETSTSTTTTGPGPRRSRWKVVVAGLVAAGLVGVAGAAAGNVFSAHTGKGPVDAEDAELGGPGERLDPRAPDFAAVLDEVTADIEFPSGKSRERALSWEIEDAVESARGERFLVTTGAMRLWMSGHALCSWSDTWAVALRTGDAAAEERAADVILGAPTWTSITDTDPDLADESEFDWLPDLEHAIRSDDPRAARKALFGNQSCMPGLAPELGLGKRW